MNRKLLFAAALAGGSEAGRRPTRDDARRASRPSASMLMVRNLRTRIARPPRPRRVAT